MRIDLRNDSRCNAHLRNRYRVLVDGTDVTNECFMADDEEGLVGVYLRDATGHHYKAADGVGAAHEFRHGAVTLIPRMESDGA